VATLASQLHPATAGQTNILTLDRSQKKTSLLSSFTHSKVVPNLYKLIYSAEHKITYFEEYG